MPGVVEAAPISCMACASSAAVQAARWLWAASASAPTCSALLLLTSSDLLKLPLPLVLELLLLLLLLDTPLKVSGRLPCSGRAKRELCGWDESSRLMSEPRDEPGLSPVLSSACRAAASRGTLFDNSVADGGSSLSRPGGGSMGDDWKGICEVSRSTLLRTKSRGAFKGATFGRGG